MTELQDLWKESEHTLNEQLNIDSGRLHASTARHLKTSLFRIPLNHLTELVMNGFFAPFLWNFAIRHQGDAWMFWSAIFLLLFTAFEIVFSLVALREYLGLRPEKSILKTQQKLNKLRLMQLWETRSLLLIIPVIVVPLLAVLIKALTGLNLYDLAGSWLLWFIGGSAFVALILVIILLRFPDKKLEMALEQLKEFSEME